jgi:hypothetical protein
MKSEASGASDAGLEFYRRSQQLLLAGKIAFPVKEVPTNLLLPICPNP